MVPPAEIIVSEVKSKKDWSEFFHLPWELNKTDPYWVPPLKMSLNQMFDLDKNPFWKTCKHHFLLARQNGKAVGRIAGMIANNQPIDGEAEGQFGFFESVSDQRISTSLLYELENWMISNGCKKMSGPFNPSINYEIGILVSGFHNPPFYMLTHNPKYYNQLLLQCGLQKEKDFYSYYIETKNFRTTDKMTRTMNALMKRNSVKIRKARMYDFKNEMLIFHDIYNDAFTKHWGFQSMSESEFNYMAKDMALIMDPELALVLELEGSPVGFMLALPDMNEVFCKIRNGKLFPLGIFKYLYYKKRIKKVRVLTVAMKQKVQHLGLGSFLYYEIANNISRRGYTAGEMSWVAEDNVQMNKGAVEMGGIIYKIYRIYSKALA